MGCCTAQLDFHDRLSIVRQEIAIQGERFSTATPVGVICVRLMLPLIVLLQEAERSLGVLPASCWQQVATRLSARDLLALHCSSRLAASALDAVPGMWQEACERSLTWKPQLRAEAARCGYVSTCTLVRTSASPPVSMSLCPPVPTSWGQGRTALKGVHQFEVCLGLSLRRLPRNDSPWQPSNQHVGWAGRRKTWCK